MGLADYFERDAQAASQVVAGFDRDAFARHVGSLEVGISFGADTVERTEGASLLDLVIRLLARFYPHLAIRGPDESSVSRAGELATRVNPKIDISTTSRPAAGIVIGRAATGFEEPIFAGSSAWVGAVSSRTMQPVGDSALPIGAGIAASLAAARLFGRVVLGSDRPAGEEFFSGWTMRPARGASGGPSVLERLGELASPVALAGAGAIGNAAAWALARVPARGQIVIVDPESIELSNVQRYVLMVRSDEGKEKAPIVAATFNGQMGAAAFVGTWGDYVPTVGHAVQAVIVGLDSAQDRRGVQASLPGWVANAWTQPGDIGLSVHAPFGAAGACLACLYTPSDRGQNEDQVYASALQIPGRLMEVRTMLQRDTPLSMEFLRAVAAGLGRDAELLLPFEGGSIRDLYIRGICGGAVLPLGSTGTARSDVHVPLAFQSVLAGVLLAASLVRHVQGGDPATTEVTQFDLLAALPALPTRPALAREACFCRDRDYVAVFRRKTALSR